MTCCTVFIEWMILFIIQLQVEYGADLHTAKHGSGFPRKGECTNNEEEVNITL